MKGGSGRPGATGGGFGPRDKRVRRSAARRRAAGVWRALESLETRLLLSGSPPVVTLNVPSVTDERVVTASILAVDGSGFGPATQATVDVDLNDDGDFDDPGETGFVDAALTPLAELVQQARLYPSEATDYIFNASWQRRFGQAINIDGDYAVIGRPLTSTTASGAQVYIFKREGDRWVEHARIDPPADGGMGRFGNAVAISGNIVVIGASTADGSGVHSSGSAYVYERVGESWQFVTELDRSNAMTSTGFGSTIDIDGQTIISSAGGDTIYIFENIAGAWTETGTIQRPSTEFDGFGSKLRIVGDTMVVAASGSIGSNGNRQPGAVYLYDRTPQGWTLTQRITPPDVVNGTGKAFGQAVALDGDTLAVSTRPGDAGRTTVYVYERVGGLWHEVAKFEQPGTPYAVDFGTSLAISGDLLVVGSGSSPDRSPVHLYQRVGGKWFDAGAYQGTADATAEFGETVALQGNTLLVGAPHLLPSVYVFEVQTPTVPTRAAVSLELTLPGEGTYRVQARVADAGSMEGDSDVQTLTIHPPSLPAVQTLIPALSTSASPSVTVVANDPEGFLPGAMAKIDIDLNGDGDFDDAGESDYAQGSLQRQPTFDFISEHAVGTLWSGDEFGTSVAMHGNRAVVGASYDSTIDEDDGAAYLYEFDGNAWNLVTQLSPSASDVGDYFGHAVAIEGNRAVVAALDEPSVFGPGHRTYVYEFNGTDWVETAVIPNLVNDGEFGYSIALSGDRLVIGHIRVNNVGAAYVYDFDGSQWNRTATLTASDAVTHALFGWSVAVDGDTVVVGDRRSSFASNQTGRAYVYQEQGGVWTQVAILTADAPANLDLFGEVVAVEGDLIAVSSANAAYAFENIGGTWTRTGRLNGASESLNDFHLPVAIDAGRIIVGMRRSDLAAVDAGAVFAYDKVGDHWVETARLTAPDAFPEDAFGTALAYHGGRLIVAANPVVSGSEGLSSGSVYFFDEVAPGGQSTTAAGVVSLPLLADGVYALRARVADALGHEGAASASWITVHTSPQLPTILSITPGSGDPIAQNNFDIYVTFSEPIQNLDRTDVVLSGPAATSASVSTPRYVSGNTWRLPVRNMRFSGNLNVSFAPDAGDVTDFDDNSVPAASWTFPVSLPGPQVTLATPDMERTLTRRSEVFRIAFSQPIVNFDKSDIVLTGTASIGATYTAPSNEGNNVYEFRIDNLSNGNLTITIAPDPNDIENPDGVDVPPTAFEFQVEVGPLVTSVTPANNALVAGSFNLDVQFSEPVLGLDAGDLQLFSAAAAGATVGTPIDLGNNLWRFPVSGLGQGWVLASLASYTGDIVDADGNAMQPVAWEFTVDTVAPQVTSVTPGAGLFHTSSAMQVTVRFDSSVTGIDVTDLIISGSAAGGAIVQLQGLNATEGRWFISGLVTGTLNLTVAPDSGDIRDLAGNSLAPFAWSVSVDLEDPTVLSTSPAAGATIFGTSLMLDFQFSEPVVNVTADDLTLVEPAAVNASVGTPIHLGNNLWRFPITGLSDGNLFVTLRGDIRDLANRLTDGWLGNFTVDTTGDLAPVVTGVALGSTSWSSAFNSHPQSAQRVLSQGYLMPTGAEQLAPLTWLAIDRVRIEFSEHVDVQAGDLLLVGVNVNDYAALLAGGTFSYDAVTFTATWTLASPIGADKLRIVLDDRVMDAAGNALDGEWAQALSSQSGDGVAGGNFDYRFNVLPADVTGDGVIESDDVSLVRDHQFAMAGHAAYDPKLDLDGGGSILGSDVIQARNRLWQALPAGEPPLVGGQGVSPGGRMPVGHPVMIESAASEVSVFQQAAPLAVIAVSPVSSEQRTTSLVPDLNLFIAWAGSAAGRAGRASAFARIANVIDPFEPTDAARDRSRPTWDSAGKRRRSPGRGVPDDRIEPPGDSESPR